ncbi:MAG: CapA family protein [Chloroflexi bacterium]|nr:CapA family protein [Chloroflexota bacterium]
MKEEFTLALTGDAVINRRLSVHTEEGFLALMKIIRDADVGYVHLEELIHDYDGPELYPAAESGGRWVRAPRFVAQELKWAGFDIVSHASNHCLDYSYGAMYTTWDALDEAGLPHAGTGRNLGDARSPAYLETPKGRIALISMSASFPTWAKAGQPRPDVKGRPGLNPLRYHFVVDAQRLEVVKQMATILGWSLRKQDKAWLMHPIGLLHSYMKFVESDQPGISTAANEDDVEGNLRAIRDARRQADWVLVSLHSHDYDPEKGESAPAKYVPAFARQCIDAGADVFTAQGSDGARGVELYKNKPIFYDPGDFIGMAETISRQPADFYMWTGFSGRLQPMEASPAEAQAVRSKVYPLFHQGPREKDRVSGSIVPICSFGEDGKLTGIKLYPVTKIEQPRSHCGLPLLADSETGPKIIEYIAKLSSAFGTTVEFKNGVGHVKLQ